LSCSCPSTGHPAPFPEKLVSDHIISWSNEGDIILDPFAGSGTTGVACKNLNRNYILIEKEPEYIEIIKKRLDLPIS
jgi:site-specific DNA-methyltransferase (adenine-specific)